MSDTTYDPSPLPLARAVDEFALTTVLLFTVVSAIRWLQDPRSPAYLTDRTIALVLVGVISGGALAALMVSPPGRRSGGHMNPAVTVALWLMDVFPGRSVAPYVLAQLAGSVAGVGLARLVWGQVLSVPPVAYAAIRPAADWHPAAVFLAEAGCLIGLCVLIGFFLAHPTFARLLPCTIGTAIAVIIIVLGPRSGGSVNPARQFGPAVISGQTLDLWIYLAAPILGAVLGASVHHLLIRRFHTRRPLTYKLAGEGKPRRARRTGSKH